MLEFIRPFVESIGYMATTIDECDRELHMNTLLGDLATSPSEKFGGATARKGAARNSR